MSQLTVGIYTLVTKDGGTLKSIKPDRNGCYKDVPLTVIGKPSRNGILYEPSSMLNALSDSNSRFFLNLTEGNLEGEWGHPLADSSQGPRAMLERMTRIERTNVSHYFSGVRTAALGNGLTVVYGNVHAFGPYGQYLKESMEDPNRNTSFSLRAVTQDIERRGNVVVRKVLLLVTFDAVDGPGFEEASKRHIPSTESMGSTFYYDVNSEVEVTATDMCTPEIKHALFSTEAITDQQVLDIFQTDQVTIVHTPLGKYDPKNNLLVRPDGTRELPFHHMFRRK